MNSSSLTAGTLITAWLELKKKDVGENFIPVPCLGENTSSYESGRAVMRI